MDVYTDGACSGNPGPGGWAWVAEDGRHDRGAEPDTTNQRMELTAVLRAVEALEGHLAIHSDSTYVVNCFNDRWYEGWLRRDWRNAQKKPVANRDLWEPLVAAYLPRREEITFTWVKGHAGVAGNEEADRLAVEAVAELRAALEGRADGTAVNAGTATVSGPEPPWLVDQAVVVTGRRQLEVEQLEELEEAVAGLDPANDVLVSGLRLGAELVGAETALRAGVPVAAVLPFADPVKVWSAEDRARFDAVLSAAHWQVTLDGDPAAPGAAIRARNRWLWAAAVGAIVVDDEAAAAEAELAGLGVIVI